MTLSRRNFLKISGLSFCTLVVSTGISGCSHSTNLTDVSFLHGVASGDPLEDSVIIWTRLSPKDEVKTLNLSYEVSKLEDFSILEHNGDITTNKDRDYTVKVDLQGLDNGTVYYYRFKSNEKISMVGKTKTISKKTTNVKMAVFSCSNYPNGYFNAYMEASKINDLDVVLHLGDYIYEYGMYNDDGITPAYGTKNAKEINRELPSDNNTELLTLNDYRKRYALYHTDKGSLALHKNVPFITVWDDHEIANDTYKDGAENHNDNEGEFEDRKLAALQAYFEWLPIRPFKTDDTQIIYRSFDFGDLVSLHMLDTRVLARNKQLNYSNYYNTNGDFDASTFTSDVSSSSRTMLGSEQLSWLKNKISESSASWQVLGQQVLMGKMLLPAYILTSISKLEGELTTSEKDLVLTDLNNKMIELISIKTRILQGDTSVTGLEKAKLETVIPYNLDAWDGYFYEREVIYETVKALNKNLVVLSGDTHNSWANNLKNNDSENIGVEFAVTSVSSPGMEEYASLSTIDKAKDFENSLTFLIDDLVYTNLNQRGFMIVEFNKEEVNTTWNYLNNYDKTEYSMDITRKKSLKNSLSNKILQEV